MSRHTLRQWRFPVLVLAVVALTLAAFRWSYRHDNKYTRRAPGAKTGILMLDIEDYEQDPLLFLVDGWEFYQYKLLSPDQIDAYAPDAYVYIGQYGGFELDDPDADPHGSATYRLTLFTDETSRDYALELPEIYSSYRVWINGQLRYSQGVDGSGAYAQTANALVAFSAAHKVEIVIAVSDSTHFYSGVTYPPAFGSPDRVSRMLTLRLAARGAALGVTLLIGLVCLMLAFWQRFCGNTHLMSLLCLCFLGFASYPVVHTIPLHGGWWYDIEKVSYYAMFFAVIWLHGRLCRLSARVYRPAMAVAALVCVWVLLFHHFWMDGAAAVMYRYSALLSAYILIAGFYLLCTTAYALLRGNAYSKPLLCGFAVFACALVFDRVYPLFEPILLGWHTEMAGFALVLIVAGAVCWDAALAHRERRVLREREQAALTMLQGEREKAQIQQAFAEEMMRLRHDAKSRLLALQTYLAGGRYDRAQSELLTQLGELGDIVPSAYTDNDLINAFLSSAAFRARRDGVDLQLELSDIPPRLTLSDKDLAALLSNILDNALEACGRMDAAETRWIRLELLWHNGMLALDCRNTYSGNVQMRHGQYRTLKEDHARHGYGLRIVREIVDRCEGVVLVTHTADIFRVYLTVNAEACPPHAETGTTNLKGGMRDVSDCGL